MKALTGRHCSNIKAFSVSPFQLQYSIHVYKYTFVGFCAVILMFVLLFWFILVLVMIRLQRCAVIAYSKPPHYARRYYAHIVALCQSRNPISPFHLILMLTCTRRTQLHTFPRSYAHPLEGSLFTHSYNTTPSSTLFITATSPLGSVSRSESEGVSAMHMKCSPHPLLNVSKEDCAEQGLSDLPETNSGADGSGQPQSLTPSLFIWLDLFLQRFFFSPGQHYLS